jgi:hypothetical protein
MKTITAIPFLLVAALVVHVSGSFGGTAVWNALPVGVGFGALRIGLSFRHASGCALSSRLAFRLGWHCDRFLHFSGRFPFCSALGGSFRRHHRIGGVGASVKLFEGGRMIQRPNHAMQ